MRRLGIKNKKNLKYSITGIINFFLSISILAFFLIVLYALKVGVIQYDLADFFYVLLITIVPVISIIGGLIGFIDLLLGRKTLFPILGISINGLVLLAIFIHWTHLFMFFRGFDSWID